MTKKADSLTCFPGEASSLLSRDEEQQQEHNQGPSSVSPRGSFVILTKTIVLFLVLSIGVMGTYVSGRTATTTSESLSTVPLLGKPHHRHDDEDGRFLEDVSYIDVHVACEDAFFSDFYLNPINVIRADGIDSVQQTGDLYSYVYNGLVVKAWIGMDDDNMECTLVSLGVDFSVIETLTYYLKFVPLPSDVKARPIVSPQQDLTEGCRLVRTYDAIFTAEGGLTAKAFMKGLDPEMIHLRELFESMFDYSKK